MAGIIRVDLPEAPFQKPPIHGSRQLRQRMIHVDDLIEPGAKQILLARLPPFPWPHLVPPFGAAIRQRITNQIRKETPFQRKVSGKFDLQTRSFWDSKSSPWDLLHGRRPP